MTAIDLIERPRIPRLDQMLEARRIDDAEDRTIAFELRHIGNVHSEMCPDRR
jgi:hypothetical protein